jgi:hypothetical protein
MAGRARLYPDQTSINAGQATQPDPRKIKAQRHYEETRREAFSLQAELDARRAVEHRDEFLFLRQHVVPVEHRFAPL